MTLHSYRRINGHKAKLLQRIKALHPALATEISELKLPWYAIRNAAPLSSSEDESISEVFIYDEIGGSFGVDANQFIQDLQAIDTDNITVRINSPGGSVIDAIAIYSALVQHPANVTTRVDSMAASAASVIAMAGDTIEMMVGSQLMIHDAMSAELGNPKELRELATWLDEQSDNIASIYAERGRNRAPEEWRAMMKNETWMFATEAVELGLADTVYTRKVRQAFEDVEFDPTKSEDEQPADEESDETADDTEAVEAEALAVLMNRRHVLTNRGFKYSGRERAPAPLEANIDAFVNVFQNTLRK